jgi:hypothetical protein
MAKITEADEYLRVIGRLMPPDCDDKTWLLVIASAYANGLIGEINWDTEQSAILMGFIDQVYPDFQEWLAAEEIDPADFPRS